MNIREAVSKDIRQIQVLLHQVLMVHHNGRSDLFKANVSKYTNEQLEAILHDKESVVFVIEDQSKLVAYAFCKIQNIEEHNIFQNMKTLYIDDLCVDESQRGKHYGKILYEFVRTYAKNIGCYNVTLNVWSCNTGAIKFYEKRGLKPQKIGLEEIL